MADQKMHIRHCLLYEFEQGHSATAASENIHKTFGDAAISYPQCAKWFHKFRSGDHNLEDLTRSGRPTEVDDEELLAAIDSDPKLTTRELEDMFSTSHTSIENHLHELGKTSRAGRWVPHKLSEMNKNQRMTHCYSILRLSKNSGFWHSILTSDEKWIRYDNVTRKRQWLSSGQVPESTSKPNSYGKKVMLCCWWNYRGLVYYEVRKTGQTVNADVYCQQLEKVQNSLVQQGIDPSAVRFLHDNARPHVAKKTLAKIDDLGWELLPHPPYSPDLAPSDYHLFRSMQNQLAEQHFDNDEEAENWVLKYFATKPAAFFEEGIRNLHNRCKSVISIDGDYIVD
jgi:histone-lysine N-methyltransferase SETMAR